jgi:phosphatidylserine decarboxylase
MRLSGLPKIFLRGEVGITKQQRYLAYAGSSVVVVTAILNHKFHECVEVVGNPAHISSLHTIFWLRLAFGRTRSRWFGSLTELTLPVKLREPLFRLYAWMYSANLDEVRYPLDSFQSFNEFFCRPLRDGVRPISEIPDGIVSPVDGRLLTCGKLVRAGERIAQVKGATYSVSAFLGLEPVDEDFLDSSRVVHYAVLYLAPGDYHRIHSPADVEFKSGRHFCGELFPVRESLLKRVDDVFCVNERVVLSGTWRFGQIHLAAVAAANVGNIYLNFDGRLKTNRMRDIAVHCGGDVSSKLYPGGVRLSPGDAFGGFRLGSTVVLFFDAPDDFQWKVDVGSAVRVGMPLGGLS